MKGSILASEIDREYKIRKIYEKKKRQQCILNNKKQCDKCKYEDVCLNKE